MSPNLRCRDYYQTQFAGYARYLACGVALDECLHDFLDQRPSGKYTQRHRASGLAGADFWWQPANVEELLWPVWRLRVYCILMT